MVKAKKSKQKKSKSLKNKKKTSSSLRNTVNRKKVTAKKEQKGYSAQELAHFKKIIIEKRKDILEELELLRNTMIDVATGEYTSENPSYSLHMEQGTDAMEREKTFLLASREGKFLNYLDDALERIEKGVYGFCLVCNKLIEKERLEAVPHAQMCYNCKTKPVKKETKP